MPVKYAVPCQGQWLKGSGNQGKHFAMPWQQPGHAKQLGTCDCADKQEVCLPLGRASVSDEAHSASAGISTVPEQRIEHRRAAT